MFFRKQTLLLSHVDLWHLGSELFTQWQAQRRSVAPRIAVSSDRRARWKLLVFITKSKVWLKSEHVQLLPPLIHFLSVQIQTSDKFLCWFVASTCWRSVIWMFIFAGAVECYCTSKTQKQWNPPFVKTNYKYWKQIQLALYVQQLQWLSKIAVRNQF